MITARTIPKTVLQRQLEAADPAVSVFVSANAGSGKTHVLVQRVINLLLRGVDPATILCITYTKAAAANMSNRVFGELAKWTALDDTALDAEIKRNSNVNIDAALRARARRLFAMALETPGGFKVQTIHAFCTRLLHQFPFEADVAARFTVTDEAAARQMLDQLTLKVLLEAAAKPDSALGLALAQIIRTTADQTALEVINDAIKKRDELLEWVKRSGGLDGAMAELTAALGIAPGDTAQAIENEYISGSILPAAEWPALAEIFASGSKTDKELGDALNAAMAASGRERIELYRGIFLTKEKTPRKKLLTKKPAEVHPQWNERLYAEQDRIVALLARERAMDARERTRALLTIALTVIERYRIEKERRALLDYDDLIEKTAALFRNTSAAWVLYKLDAGIDHVLIDEAQDTSPRQWDIISTIVTEFSPGGARPNTLRTMFAVGDEKQSIFSFQGAAPRRFDEMRREFARQFDRPELGWRYVRLEHSFRSGENVLGSVDRVFHEREIFTSVTSDAAGVPPHLALPDAAPGMVEIWPLIAPAERPAMEGWDAPFDTVSEASPTAQLAKRIADTVKVWESQGTRPGEVLILVRRRNALFETIISALKQQGIAVAGADRLVLTEHIAVMDLLVLADALLLPDDDLAVATVLKSPLFGLDDDQLLALAWDRKASLREMLRAKANDDTMFAAASRALDEYTRASRQLSPFDFYAHVLGARRGRKAFLSRLGMEAADALDEFLNLALEYEQRETPSLQGFVHWMRAAKSEIKRDMELSRDEVRVMTVHGAKGLEARNVILADTIAKPAGPKDPRLLPLPVTGRAAGTHAIVWANAKANDTEIITDARQAAQIEAQDEYRRLLYVAMTRAAERLVVCGARGKNEPPQGNWYQLVTQALVPHSVSEPAEAGGGDVLRFYIRKPEAASHSRDAKDVIKKQIVPSWLMKQATDEPSRVRVITPSDSGDDSPAPAGHDSSRAKALLRGSLIHRMMQSLPDLTAEHRATAAAKFLASAAKDFTDAERSEMAAQVMRLLGDARFAALFAPGSRAEVSIAGRLTVPGKQDIVVSGQIDRLTVTESDVLIADYKTNRPAPSTAEQALSRHPAYVRQLALYRAVLMKLYPGKAVRAALVWTDVPDFMELSAESLDSALRQVTSA